MPNSNYQWSTAQELASPTSKWGQGREAWGALLRVKTRPECPEGNLRDPA